MQTRILILSSMLFLSVNSFAQSDSLKTAYRFSVSTTWLSFGNWEPEKTNIQMYEFHFKYKLTHKDKIGVKFATWKLFRPMGILWWEDALTMDESEFYPGRLRETGVGATYQRMLWKGLFATMEIVPMVNTYLDENKNKICNGFKLYTSYHVGYHISFFKNRMFIELQIHCSYWPVDTNIPQGFKEIDNKYHNYFLFEPNVYIGVKFW